MSFVNMFAQYNCLVILSSLSECLDIIYMTGNSLTGSDKSANMPNSNYQYNRPAVLHSAVDNFDMMEYPFVTLSKYPPGFIIHLGML